MDLRGPTKRPARQIGSVAVPENPIALPSGKGAQNFQVPLDPKVPTIAVALAEEATATPLETADITT